MFNHRQDNIKDMTGRIIECSRCGVVGIIPEKLNYVEDQLAHYYCADCLIDMMPEKVELSSTEPHKREKGSTENRINSRFPVFAPIRLSPINRGIEVTSALIMDTSLSGVRIMTQLVLHPGEDIVFTIMGAEKNYHAAGEVVYSEVFGENSPRQQYQIGIKLDRVIQPEDFHGLISFKSKYKQ